MMKFLHFYCNLSTQHALLLLHHCVNSWQVCFILVIDPSSILATTVIPLLVDRQRIDDSEIIEQNLSE